LAFSLPFSFGQAEVKIGAAALPLHDIPVIAALIHPWMLPPLCKSACAPMRAEKSIHRGDCI
jgi:hypothetical protein